MNALLAVKSAALPDTDRASVDPAPEKYAP
jgi:hypothetical protein